MSSPPWLLLMVLVMDAITAPINCSTSKKLDDLSVPTAGTPVPGIKCTTCSCQNPCNQPHPPPPPSLPPPPPPPPPCLPPPPPPIPTPTSPSMQCCHTPSPPPPFYYFTGMPGSLYSFDLDYSGAGLDFRVGLAVLVGCQLLGMLVLWRL